MMTGDDLGAGRQEWVLDDWPYRRGPRHNFADNVMTTVEA